jgi:Tol biopolymer transport system component
MSRRIAFLLILISSMNGLSYSHARSETPTTNEVIRTNPDGLSRFKNLPADASAHKRVSVAQSSAAVTSPVNGKIAFVSGRAGKGLDIYVMNQDGSGVTKITSAVDFPNEPWRNTYNTEPAWSPDGTQIAYVSNRGINFNIYLMNADGSNVRRLTSTAADESGLSWSPDGTKIVFGRGYCASVAAGPPPPPTDQCAADLFVMNADGSNQTRLTSGPDSDGGPAWSPDGTRIAFSRYISESHESDIFVVNADGSGLTNITGDADDNWNPAWSPDATRIAFANFSSLDNSQSQIYVMSADGSNATALTKDPAYMNDNPDWSPDGTKIAFARALFNSPDVWDVYLMNSDGSQLTILTPDTPQDAGFDQYDTQPDWQTLNNAGQRPPSQGSFQFSSPSFQVFEGGVGDDPIIITRLGDVSQAATVDFTTSSTCPGTPDPVCTSPASELSDYTTTSGTLRFSPGEADKVIHVPVIDDVFIEGKESFHILLSNPAGGVLGGNKTALVGIRDNDTSASPGNPIDEIKFFVRQHYLDFLNREPEPEGYQAWQTILKTCASGDKTCDRTEVSAGFFRSKEFQERGSFVYRFYSTSFARVPRYAEFMPDLAKVSGFQSDEQLEANKAAFIKEFMARPEFKKKYDSLTEPGAFVNALENTAGVNLSNKQRLIDDLAAGRKMRTEVLRAVAESGEVYRKYFNESFVVMQYFGYLRRDPDILYLEWIKTMDQTGDYRTMINGFMNSAEYRQRFGP